MVRHSWQVALWIASVVLPSVAYAQPHARQGAPTIPHRASARHYSPPHKPAGVPAEFVITPNGFFHPACVVNVHSDEVMGTDLVIRGTDGAPHARVDPCAYPRFDLRGRLVDPGPASPPSPVGGFSPDAYNGWIAQYSYVGSIASGSNLTDYWVVPPLPQNQGSQTLFFFNGIQGNSILQPVMAYSGTAPWNFASWSCCIQGDQQQSDTINLSPGDVLQGTVTSANCDSSGVCQNWTITSTDMTTGQSVTLNAGADVGTPNIVVPAVLETYDVSSCDMFPVTGEETFYGNSLTDSNGHPETVPYHLLFDTGGNGTSGGLPACGFGGTSSGDSYTLIFSMSPMGGGPPDAGGDDASSDMDASESGSSSGGHDATMPPDDGSFESGNSGGMPESGGGSSSGSSSGGASSSSGGTGSGGGSSTSSGSSGSTSSSSGSSSGGVVPDAAGPSQGALEGGPSEDASNGDVASFSSQPSGCSCEAMGRPEVDQHTPAVCALILAGTVAIRRRRRRESPSRSRLRSPSADAALSCPSPSRRRAARTS
jgi:hypothetical protein